MNAHRWFVAILALAGAIPDVCLAGPLGARKFEHVQAQLCGQLLDFTNNHGVDRRIWSPALCQKRDLYVYLPPCFDPVKKYPVMLYLHGFFQDEQFFSSRQVKLLDQAMASGRLPPMIVAAPDGSIRGRPSYFKSSTVFANSRVGNFEDYLIIDVWDFLTENFPIRPEPEAHVLVGLSLGGAAAFRLAIEHQERFKVAAGLMPVVNIRYVDCHQHYRGKFDPDCWDYRARTKSHEIIGRYYGLAIPARAFMDAVIPRGQRGVEEMSRLNPLEAFERENVKEGDVAMFMGYGGRDQFNIDSQVESFAYVAREHGVTVTVVCDPAGRHDSRTATELFGPMIDWLAPLVQPYAPGVSVATPAQPSVTPGA